MVTVIGGIALFMLGMMMLTNGLKEVAGEALRKWLHTFTKGKISAIVSGLIMTILVQSSTATTLLTIGFVSAGLLTFMQSIGVVIGANIGSTSTGWIISLIGFKISLQAMALPIIALGVFIQLIAPHNIKKYGGIFTGFGLLFLGIDLLQQGMSSAQDLISFESFSTDSILSIVMLIVIGIVMTIIMQASSAALATTLTALFAGAIEFEQAAFLVIGQNIGTTATALFAAIGSSVAAKRTAVTHLLFNVITAIIVSVFIVYILQLVEFLTIQFAGKFDEPLGITLFHTLFSLIGAIIFVPFIKPFSKLLMKIIPEKENKLTRNLDTNLLSVPQAALEVSYETLMQIMKHLNNGMLLLIEQKKVTGNVEKIINEVEEAIDIVRKYLDDIHSFSSKYHHRQLNILHALDHITRLIKVYREKQIQDAMIYQPKFINRVHNLLIEVDVMMNNGESMIEIAQLLENTSQQMAAERRTKRNEYFERSAKNETELDLAVSKVEALLWIDRLVYHYWRATARMAMYVESTEKRNEKQNSEN